MQEPGRPLAEPFRTALETVFETDLSGVRIHLGPSAAALGTAAFTIDDSIYFQPQHFDPRTPAGLQLLGHELAHVIQQRSGALTNPYRAGIAIVDDPDLEHQAAHMGRRTAAHLASYPHHVLPAGRGAAMPLAAGKRFSATVQRMESSESSNWYSSYLGNRPDREYRRERQETGSIAKQLAMVAFENMRRLVVKHDRDSAKREIQNEDREAARIYGLDDEDLTHIAACAHYARADGQRVAIYATNSEIPKTFVPDLRGAQYIKAFDEPNIGNQPFYHAEIKVYMAAEKDTDKWGDKCIQYIGVSKLCCLYCAAQLLAKGFKGFRGCSMVAFNNYKWLPALDDYQFVEKLWGEDVAGQLKTGGKDLQSLFLHEISQGSTLMQAIGIREDYSKVNQYPLDSYYWHS